MSIIHVPVSRAVRKYLLREYANFVISENDRELIQLHRKYFLGNFIASLMTNDLQFYRPAPRPESYITFKFSKKFEKSYIPEENMAKLAYHLDHLFKTEFCKFLGFYHSFGLSLTEAMDSFYIKYDLTEDDYSRDSMRRYYNRYGEAGSEWQEKQEKKIVHSRPAKLDKTKEEAPVYSKFQRLRTQFVILQETGINNCNYLRLRKQMLLHRKKSSA